jgi:hypothetical protein
VTDQLNFNRAISPALICSAAEEAWATLTADWWGFRDPTPWLTMQSGANQSQAAKFPGNREKYRENRKFGLQNDDGITSKTQHPCGF